MARGMCGIQRDRPLEAADGLGLASRGVMQTAEVIPSPCERRLDLDRPPVMHRGLGDLPGILQNDAQSEMQLRIVERASIACRNAAAVAAV